MDESGNSDSGRIYPPTPPNEFFSLEAPQHDTPVEIVGNMRYPESSEPQHPPRSQPVTNLEILHEPSSLADQESDRTPHKFFDDPLQIARQRESNRSPSNTTSTNRRQYDEVSIQSDQISVCEDLHMLRQELRRKKKELDDARRRCIIAETTSQSEKIKVTLLEEENHKLRHELTMNNHSDDHMRNEIEHLKDIVKNNKRDIERLQGEVQMVNQEKTKFREHMTAMQKESEGTKIEYEAKFSEMTSENDTLKQRIELLQIELSAAREGNSSFTTTRQPVETDSTLSEQLAAKDLQLAQLQEEIRRMQAEYESTLDSISLLGSTTATPVQVEQAQPPEQITADTEPEPAIPTPIPVQSEEEEPPPQHAHEVINFDAEDSGAGDSIEPQPIDVVEESKEPYQDIEPIPDASEPTDFDLLVDTGAPVQPQIAYVAAAFFSEGHGNDAENFFESISSLDTVPRTLFD